MAQETQTGALYQPVVWDAEGDGKEVPKGGDICIPMELKKTFFLIFKKVKKKIKKNLTLSTIL